MTDIFLNVSTLDVDISLEDYKPTDLLLLTLDTLHSNVQFVLTKEQLEKLRTAIYLTSEEERKMAEYYGEKAGYYEAKYGH